MIKAEELVEFDLDVIPKYLLMRDILKIDKDNKLMKNTKCKLLETKWVKDIVNLQWDDGSWGRFHSMSTSSKTSITTERALRRLLILGLDKADEPIQRVLSYMNKYLNRDLDLRDYKEKKHDWDLLTRLFVATWIINIDPSNAEAKAIANKWANVITHAFSSANYDHEAYLEAYYETHKPEKGKVIWGFQNYYLVSILSGFLTASIESKFLDYIISKDKGIYYIYDGKLTAPPKIFPSKQSSRYIYAYELLSKYSCAKTKSNGFMNWLYENVAKDGFWDMGQTVKDKMQYPLSNSWRRDLNRKIDCTIRIQRILSQLEN
ncbi:hypothetical protein [Vallitalea okinawensis]|uniref:hypothetical protein n=1 Tax=Vallitalea okinawensis TaxID=2078660 RepID=UPI000CFC222E|nr:hypothetical protein [Vallitalea okinawensis]